MTTTSSTPSFALGRIVATAAVSEAIEDDLGFKLGVMTSLTRHARGDWGTVSKADGRANDQALVDGTRLVSSYTIANKQVWIITEADRSVTTVLFPEEY